MPLTAEYQRCHAASDSGDLGGGGSRQPKIKPNCRADMNRLMGGDIVYDPPKSPQTSDPPTVAAQGVPSFYVPLYTRLSSVTPHPQPFLPFPSAPLASRYLVGLFEKYETAAKLIT